MGKNKNRATRKELEEVVGKLIQELNLLRNAFHALDSYVGYYVEWKGDKLNYTNHLQEKFQDKTETPKLDKDTKGEKRKRYDKISQPL